MVDVAGWIVAVVDDDTRVLESLESLLESAGYAVRLFSSATAFLQSGVLAQIHCLISDIGMPVMDGFELQRAVNLARPELPVILITGRNAADRHGALDPDDGPVPGQGHRSFFRKPFNAQELLVAVEAAVRSPG